MTMIKSNEAAQILGLSIGTFHRRLADGTIPLTVPKLSPYLKRAKSLQFDRVEVELLARTGPPVPVRI